MGDLNRWVRDELHTLVGFSDRSVADFIVAMAQKKPKESAVLAELENVDVPINDKAKKFVTELLKRIPKKEKSYQAKEAEARALISKNASFTMVEDDDDDTERALLEQARVQQQKKERQMQRDNEKLARKETKAAKKRKKEDEESGVSRREGETEEDARERERLQDLEERDAFALRIKEKEEAQTKKFGKRKLTEQEKLLETLTEQEREDLVPELRLKSRRSYVDKRAQQQILIAEDLVKYEETVFDGEKLSAAEKRRAEVQRKTLELAKKRITKHTDEKMYQIPDGFLTEDGKIDKTKKEAVIRAKYEEEVKQRTDQEFWEDEQTHHAVMKFGAKDKEDPSKKFEYVFEDQIDFIQAEMAKGQKPERENDSESDNEADTEFERIQKQRRGLPVYPYREELIQAITEYQILIVVGETGSGKTTQIMQYLIEEGFAKKGKIGCTQPRRVAAMSVAARVAVEMGVKLGHEVGYSIRFEDCTSDRTLLKYMTDGMLLREFLGEPDLTSYSVLMIDEAHERTLHTDILFGLVKDITRFRKDIKLIISSATLDAQKFSDYFDLAPIFVIPGRRYDVDIYYTKAPEADYLDAAIVSVLQIHITQPKGDILVFFTGQEEIETAEETLNTRMKGLGTKVGELLVLPIYANLPSDMQAKIFEPTPPGARKVVLATNIAETSLTIDGIIYVIDPGFSKQKSYNPRTGMEALIVTPVSQASAKQRAGRAGRVAPGKCFRLYTKHAYVNELEETTIPEIQRTNLGNVVLMLKSLGINDLIHFDFMDPPPAETLIKALEQLYALGSLNDRGELTKLGRRMAELPLEPMLAKCLIASETYECSSEILTICAMLGTSASIFFRPKNKQVHADNAHKNFWSPAGDHITLLNIYNQWKESDYATGWCVDNYIQHRSMKRARDVREQLEDMLARVEVELVENEDDVKIRKAITSGFFYNTAKLEGSGSYKTVKHRQSVQIHPSSCLHGELARWVVYFELVLTSKEFMRQVSEILPEWLVEIAPHFFKKKDIMDDPKTKMPKKKGASLADLALPT